MAFGETLEGQKSNIETPTVRLFDGDGNLLATQSVDRDGPILADKCSIFVAFKEIPVAESYRAVFEGIGADGQEFKVEGTTRLDRSKITKGQTQGIKLDASK
ncbi:hypothetical protein [Brachybacterium huguangmaarense]